MTGERTEQALARIERALDRIGMATDRIGQTVNDQGSEVRRLRGSITETLADLDRLLAVGTDSAEQPI